MSTIETPELELVELPEVSDIVLCDIGRHRNMDNAPCPNVASWRIAYSCCWVSTLLCTPHKEKFMSRVYREYTPSEPTKCPHCGKVNIFLDILIVSAL